MRKVCILALAACLAGSTVFAGEAKEEMKRPTLRQRVDAIMQESKLYIFSDNYRRRLESSLKGGMTVSQPQIPTAAAEIDQSGDAVYLDYDSCSTYDIYCRPGAITDVRLEHGEKLLHIIAGRDVGLEYRCIDDGRGWHIYLQPIQKGMETNMVVATDKRNYQLNIRSNEHYWPIVLWRYGDG